MKSIYYDVVINSVSDIQGGYDIGYFVDVGHHLEGGNLPAGVRDGFQTTRVYLKRETICNPADILDQIVSEIGLTQEV